MEKSRNCIRRTRTTTSNRQSPYFIILDKQKFLSNHNSLLYKISQTGTLPLGKILNSWCINWFAFEVKILSVSWVKHGNHFNIKRSKNYEIKIKKVVLPCRIMNLGNWWLLVVITVCHLKLRLFPFLMVTVIWWRICFSKRGWFYLFIASMGESARLAPSSCFIW